MGDQVLRSMMTQLEIVAAIDAPIWTDENLLVRSVRRFKGQAAPCVVFTEIDFETLDDKAVRRIFVGATRATMKLTLVVSEGAAKVLLNRLEN